MMKMIVAIDKNRCIGKDGGLPWPKIKEDFDFFREVTIGNTLLVGRKTFETLPILRERSLVVLTKSLKEPTPLSFTSRLQQWTHHSINTMLIGGKLVSVPLIASKDNIHEVFDANPKTTFIIAGGAEIYQYYLNKVDRLFVTHVKGDFTGDTFFPEFENLFKKTRTIKSGDNFEIVEYEPNQKAQIAA